MLAKHDLENKVEGKAEQARRMTETKLITAAGKMKAKSPIGNMAQRAAILGERHATLRHVPADCLLQASDGSDGTGGDAFARLQALCTRPDGKQELEEVRKNWRKPTSGWCAWRA